MEIKIRASEVGRNAIVSDLRVPGKYMLILLIDNKQLTFFAFGSPFPGNFPFFSLAVL